MINYQLSMINELDSFQALLEFVYNYRYQFYSEF